MFIQRETSDFDRQTGSPHSTHRRDVVGCDPMLGRAGPGWAGLGPHMRSRSIKDERGGETASAYGERLDS